MDSENEQNLRDEEWQDQTHAPGDIFRPTIDEEKLSEALQRLNMEDPTIRVEYSKELKQTIISGQGEYHLNIVKWHLDNIFKIVILKEQLILFLVMQLCFLKIAL